MTFSQNVPLKSALKDTGNMQARVPGSKPIVRTFDANNSSKVCDKQLFEYVKLGGEELFKDFPDIVSNMPGFGDELSNEEIWAIFAFIKSTWSDENLKWQKGASKLDKLPEEYLPEDRQ